MDDLAARLACDLDGSFELLVRTHQHAVLTVARRLCAASPSDAEDVAQEAFARAYRALSGYGPERTAALALRPWLVRIALNVRRNDVRRAGRRPGRAPLDDDAAVAPAVEGPEERAERGEDRSALVALLGALPEHERVAVVLRHVVGLSSAEAADALGCPVGTVKARASRGMRALRERAARAATEEVR